MNFLFIKDVSKYGILDGKLTSEVRIIGSCGGTQSGVFTCGGKNKYIKWSRDIGIQDFEIRSEFQVDLVDETAITFVLWSGNTEFHLGLDGKGNTLFYESRREGSALDGPYLYGPTNLNPDKFQTIIIKRREGKLKVSVDGVAWDDISFSSSIDAVGWRPWRNTIHIKDLVQIVDKGNINTKIIRPKFMLL